MTWIITWLNQCTTSIFLVFCVIVGGYYLGKIQICDLSLDLSGVLVLAILLGIFLSEVPTVSIGEITVYFCDDDFKSSMTFLTSFGTAIFISVISLSAGYQFFSGARKKQLVFFIIGIAMVSFGMTLMMIIHYFDKEIDFSLLLGVFCGAMTSTPGLTVVCESSDMNSSLATTGYSSTYLLGIISVVLLVQTIGKKERVISKAEPTALPPLKKLPDFYGIIQVAVTIIGGYALGSMEISFTNFSLGYSGGILCVGIFIGLCVAQKNSAQIIPKQNLDLLRGLGLVLFFAGSGISAGMQLVSFLNIRCVLYGFGLTVFTLIFGYAVSLLLVQKNFSKALCIVCGGMTSTPAIGILLRKNNTTVDLSAYSIAYTGSLIATVIGVRILTT